MTPSSLTLPHNSVDNAIPKPVEQINQSSSWLIKAVKWLRAHDEQTPLIVIAKNALVIFLAILLSVTLIGIPLVWLGYKRWQELGKLRNNAANTPPNLGNSIPQHPHSNNPSAIPASKLAGWVPLTARETMTLHNKACEKTGFSPPLLRPSHFEPQEDTWATLEGISLLADNLWKKKGLDRLEGHNGFYVCQSLKVLQNRLEAIDKTNESTRQVLIVPSQQPGWTCDSKDVTQCSNSQHQNPDYHNQHKVPVMVEKKDGKIKICVLCSSQEFFLNIPQTYLDDGSKFSCSEQIHAFIRAAKLPQTTTYYHAQHKRHFSDTGACSTFALQDGVSFLRMPDFFEEIEKKGGCIPDSNTYLSQCTGEKGTIDNPYYVRQLPPVFVRLTQSTSRIQKYENDNAEGGDLAYDLNQKLGKKRHTLKQKLARVSEERGKGSDKKSLNKAIDYKIDMSKRQILKALENKTPDELHEKIRRRLLVV